MWGARLGLLGLAASAAFATWSWGDTSPVAMAQVGATQRVVANPTNTPRLPIVARPTSTPRLPNSRAAQADKYPPATNRGAAHQHADTAASRDTFTW